MSPILLDLAFMCPDTLSSSIRIRLIYPHQQEGSTPSQTMNLPPVILMPSVFYPKLLKSKIFAEDVDCNSPT